MSKMPEESPLQKSLDDHLRRVREKIVQKAEDLASDDEQEEVGISHLAKAIEQYAPSHEIPRSELVEARDGFLAHFPPLAVLSSMLAIAFAALGLWATLGSAEVKANLGGQGFLDIAKIFAGAIVGSATATISSSLKRGKS